MSEEIPITTLKHDISEQPTFIQSEPLKRDLAFMPLYKENLQKIELISETLIDKTKGASKRELKHRRKVENFRRIFGY